MTRRIVFLFNLLQDVNILRPLALLAHREVDCQIMFLVSKGFWSRDKSRTWAAELRSLQNTIGATEETYTSPMEALTVLAGGQGVIFAGSESDEPAHSETHDVFRAAPRSYLRVTLQHGLECIGFRQTREHILRHSRNIGFGADIVCTWQYPEGLSAMKASERGKVLVTGPTSLLQKTLPDQAQVPTSGGLICENLHSVRLQTTAAHDKPFMAIFEAFCHEQAAQGRDVTLRPHPGGQYVIKNKLPLPENVVLNNLPIYRVDFSQYAYGLSAPSTIVLDMVMAGLPTAVWRDDAETMDTRGYDGLTPVSTLEDWLAFERDVRLRPDLIHARQHRWLDTIGLQRDAQLAYKRFAQLMTSALS